MNRMNMRNKIILPIERPAVVSNGTNILARRKMNGPNMAEKRSFSTKASNVIASFPPTHEKGLSGRTKGYNAHERALVWVSLTCYICPSMEAHLRAFVGMS